MSDALQHIISHILSNRISSDPLFVAIQGPQGSGKTFLSNLIHNTLTSPPHSLAVAVLSIDDLYLSHTDLVALADAHPDNGLLRGRGLPGTHDIPLSKTVFNALKCGTQVALPSFDKSLYGGEGDRSSANTIITGPVDVVILEGWCVGFYPITAEELEKRWEMHATDWRITDIQEVNEKLKEYVALWAFFDVFIQLKPSSPYSIIYKWRLEQEHDMKANNGGHGMSDHQVQRFVDRYIPGYVFFGDGVRSPSDASKVNPPWTGKGLLITIGDKREVVDVANF